MRRFISTRGTEKSATKIFCCRSFFRTSRSITEWQPATPIDPSPEFPEELDLTSEAGHSVPRIIHFKDKTGFSIERAFVERVRSHPKVNVISNATAVDLLTASHHSVEPTDVYRRLTCVGAYVLNQATGKIFKRKLRDPYWTDAAKFRPNKSQDP